MISPDIISLHLSPLHHGNCRSQPWLHIKVTWELKKIPIPNICPDVLGQGPRAVPCCPFIEAPHVNVQTRLKSLMTTDLSQ